MNKKNMSHNTRNIISITRKKVYNEYEQSNGQIVDDINDSNDIKSECYQIEVSEPKLASNINN